jgi:hypothetical protein
MCTGYTYLLLAVIALTVVQGCSRDRIVPVYDQSGTIRRLEYDTNGDDRIDMRAYLQDGRTTRLEADGNGDGIVDRWEYYGSDGQLDRIGTSSIGDGREDTWVARHGNDMRVDISTRRDGTADRHEYHQNGVLVRVEQDTNGDGRIDEWQIFSGGRLSELRLDTSLRSGQPDTRLVYASDGSVQLTEHVSDDHP